MFTGKSVAVEERSAPDAAEAGIAGRGSRLCKGTSLVRSSGVGVELAIGTPPNSTASRSWRRKRSPSAIPLLVVPAYVPGLAGALHLVPLAVAA